MPIKDKLQIILITYNRLKYLKNTLENLLDSQSPIKDFDLTILDNKSNDGSSELIKEYVKRHPNIKHIINNRNIGGNGNIAHAITIADKEYVWIICDDDKYDFSNWDKVEKAIMEKHDVIIVDNEYIKYPDEIADIIFQLSFLPSGIYKTEKIDNNVIRNVYDNISNWFPHLPLAINIANTSKDFYILDNPVVKNGQQERIMNNEKCSDDSLIRDNDFDKVYPEQTIYNWQIAYIRSLSILNGGRKTVSKAIDLAIKHPPANVGNNIYSFTKQIVEASNRNRLFSGIFYDIYYRLSFKYKLLLIWHKLVQILIPFFTTNRGIYIRIGALKTKIIPFTFSKKRTS